MVDKSIPDCPECRSNEVVVHKHDVVPLGKTGRKYIADFECLECGRQWRLAPVEVVGRPQTTVVAARR
jgi:hypothetical protein